MTDSLVSQLTAQNFTTAIHRAITSCKSMGYDEADHFRGITKMVKVGSDTQRPDLKSCENRQVFVEKCRMAEGYEHGASRFVG
jgi:hypothetical protein